VKSPVVPIVAAIAALAAAGCGDTAHGSGSAPAGPAPDAERTQDLVPLTTAQAAKRAERIALVVSRGSRVVEGAPGTPFTRTTFAVEHVLKGELPRRIVVQVIGGRLGDTVVASPLQAFAAAGRYILFLGPDGRVGPTIFPQAVLEVKRAGGTDVVEPAPSGLGTVPSKPARLDGVLASIRRYVRAR
jgi:hypothetical protein